jgi:RNA polymerase sigma-70 factor (ECF subfamily)
VLRNDSDAREAVQEAWWEILKNVGKYENRSQLSTWIYTVTYRTALRLAKRERSYSEIFIHDYIHIQNHPEEPPNGYDKERWVQDACNNCLTGFLYCLTPDERIIYVLRDVAELDYSLIATISNKRAVTVRKQVTRIRARLRKFIQKECILFNRNADCNCRMRNHVKEIRLDLECERIREELHTRSVYKIAEEAFQKINYWKEFFA